MPTVPIKDQVIKIDMLQSVEWLLEAGERVANEYLARAVKESAGRPLPPRLLQLVVIVVGTAPEKRRKGPKGMSPAKLAHHMVSVDWRYDQLCARYREADRKRRAEKKPRRMLVERPPPVSERAYTELLRRKPDDFPSMSWESLRNLHSKWRVKMQEWKPPESGNEHPDD
jgi:hypothetical protein